MTQTVADLRERRANLATGLLLLFTLGVLISAALSAGKLEELFRPSQEIRIQLPQEGLFGLSKGSDVEILGTPAGQVREIVIDPNKRIHAIVSIRRDMTEFVRRDSVANIRKRFGVAGSAYLDITRGFEEPLDWEYAVLQARTERAPTESIGELVEEVRGEVLPLISEARKTIQTFNEVGQGLQTMQGDIDQFVSSLSILTHRIERGEGSLGRLLADDRLARELETVLGETNMLLRRLGPTLQAMETTAQDMADIAQAASAHAEDVPKMSARTLGVLKNLEEVLGDLRQTTPELPRITRNVAEATDTLAPLLLQTQQTTAELETLLRQLQSNWLIGGGRPSDQPQSTGRISPADVRP
jgi:phospholipid/cholesterol/gamma-HCH transport system substrate-binding protein